MSNEALFTLFSVCVLCGGIALALLGCMLGR